MSAFTGTTNFTGYTNSTRGELFDALAKAQSEIVGAVKDSSNPFFKSKYADLASVQDAIREPFAKNGLAVAQIMEPMDNGDFVLVTILGHKSGAEIHSRLPVVLQDRKPQAVGSQITYMRRYALAAIAGVAQIDDDAEAASGRGKRGKDADSHAHEEAAPPEIPHDTAKILEEAAADGLDALKLAWKKLRVEDRELITKHHNKWWSGLKSSSASDDSPVNGLSPHAKALVEGMERRVKP